jgi:hypothetical protein
VTLSTIPTKSGLSPDDQQQCPHCRTVDQVYFDLAEVLSWIRALPRMEAHPRRRPLLLETHTGAAVSPMLDFIMRTHGKRKNGA